MERDVDAKSLNKLCEMGDMEDKLSQLPDEILIAILSLIPHEEAARTSVLARRWKEVWTFITVLNFEKGDGFTGESKYVNCINSALDSYEGLIIEEFRVWFGLHSNNHHHVQGWVNFAFEKSVQIFVLNLHSFFHYKNYHFDMLPTVGIPKCSSVRVVQLKCVDISGEVVEYLLSNCSSLERLSIDGSDLLVDLKVDIPLLSLKHLVLIDCLHVENIDISAPNLLTFRYYGMKVVNISLGEVSNMTQLYIGDQYSHYIIFENPSTFSNDFSQLETLSLDLRRCCIEENAALVQFPELSNLKYLELAIGDLYDGDQLLLFSPLVKSSPLLKRVRIKLSRPVPSSSQRKSIEKRPAGPKYPHYNLKLVEIIGFNGKVVENEFIAYLVHTAVMLENVIIDPRRPSSLKETTSEYEPLEDHKIQAAVKNAERLRHRLCIGDKLLIL